LAAGATSNTQTVGWGLGGKELGWCRQREKSDWQEGGKFDCRLVRTIFIFCHFSQDTGEWRDWTYLHCSGTTLLNYRPRINGHQTGLQSVLAFLQTSACPFGITILHFTTTAVSGKKKFQGATQICVKHHFAFFFSGGVILWARYEFTST